MKQTKIVYAGILILINLLFTACSTTSEHNRETVPVEDRSIAGAKYQDVTADNRVATNDKKMVESASPHIGPETNVNNEDVHREEPVADQSSSPVALTFLEDAEKYATAGDSGRAVASLERGLDIEPKNPWLWNRLATERLKQKMWAKAITLAKKSNAFASGHNQLQRDNWQIIAKARLALGDTEGAKKAEEMVWYFSHKKT